MSFLDAADGAKFLAKHETLACSHDARLHPGQRRRDIAHLHILGTPVYANESRHSVSKFTLSHLKTEQEGRNKRLARCSPTHAVKCGLRGAACGKNVFSHRSATLTFAQQLYAATPGRARFGQRSLSATFGDDARRLATPQSSLFRWERRSSLPN